MATKVDAAGQSPSENRPAGVIGPMRVVVDATAVRDGGGGLSTYATSLLRAWDTTFPEDELVVVVGNEGGARLLRGVASDIRVFARGRSRLLAQQALVPLIARRTRPDAVFSLVPGVPLAPVGVPIVTVVHDLRSWIRPSEFPTWVRVYRGLAHHFAFHRSDRIVAVSERTRLDLAQVCRRSALRAHVVHPAADHVDVWSSRPRAPHMITFAHWSNKRPDLAIQAWAKALRARRPRDDWRLHVVGAPDASRRALRNAAAEHAVAESVLVHGYLSDAEYQRLFTAASAVLMLSTLEGFGLPVVEAMRRGVHVVASRDAALEEAGGPSAVYVNDEASLVHAIDAVFSDDPAVQAMVESGRLRTRHMTWASTAAKARALIQDAVADQRQRVRRAS